MRSSKRYRPDRPSLLTRAGAFAGLAFMHIPVLVIILYAFTTEDRSYQFPPPGLTLRWFSVALLASPAADMPVCARIPHDQATTSISLACLASAASRTSDLVRRG